MHQNKPHWLEKLAWNQSAQQDSSSGSVRKPNPPKGYILTSLIRAVEDLPVGYPRQAAFAASDESLLIFRRFGYLHARLLLQRQDELRQLEDELEEMDKRHSKTEAGQLRLASREMDERGSRASENGASRSALLHRIEEVALRYGFSPPFLDTSADDQDIKSPC